MRSLDLETAVASLRFASGGCVYERCALPRSPMISIDLQRSPVSSRAPPRSPAISLRPSRPCGSAREHAHLTSDLPSHRDASSELPLSLLPLPPPPPYPPPPPHTLLSSSTCLPDFVRASPFPPPPPPFSDLVRSIFVSGPDRVLALRLNATCPFGASLSMSRKEDKASSRGAASSAHGGGTVRAIALSAAAAAALPATAHALSLAGTSSRNAACDLLR